MLLILFYYNHFYLNFLFSLINNNCFRSPTDKLTKSLYFNDRLRLIDFVLVYSNVNTSETQELFGRKREIFERNLTKEGLELEIENGTENFTYVKVWPCY